MAESNAERRERRVHAGLSRELSKPGTHSTRIRPVEVLVADIDPTIHCLGQRSILDSSKTSSSDIPALDHLTG